jgi:hypothetical protein
VARVRPDPVKLIGIGKPRYQLVCIPIILNLLNIHTDCCNILLPSYCGYAVATTVGDRANDTDRPQRLSVLTAENWRSYRKANTT